jgi:hypothetical protein
MSKVTDSIQLSIKKMCNVDADYTAFDDDFVMYINSALSDLNQLGIGPADGFSISDKSDDWDDFLDEGPIRDRAKTFVGLQVRLLFDPPQTSFAINMMQDQLKEMGWRLVAAQEDKESEEAV